MRKGLTRRKQKRLIDYWVLLTDEERNHLVLLMWPRAKHVSHLAFLRHLDVLSEVKGQCSACESVANSSKQTETRSWAAAQLKILVPLREKLSDEPCQT